MMRVESRWTDCSEVTTTVCAWCNGRRVNNSEPDFEVVGNLEASAVSPDLDPKPRLERSERVCICEASQSIGLLSNHSSQFHGCAVFLCSPPAAGVLPVFRNRETSRDNGQRGSVCNSLWRHDDHIPSPQARGAQRESPQPHMHGECRGSRPRC